MKLPGSFAHVLCPQPLSSQLLAYHPYVSIFRNESLMYVFPLLVPPGHILPLFHADLKFLFTEDGTWKIWHPPSHQTKLSTPSLEWLSVTVSFSVTMRRYLSNELPEEKGLSWRSQSIGQLHCFEATVRQHTMLGGTQYSATIYVMR